MMYVTLGTNSLKGELFQPIQNRRGGWLNKPDGGLWACRFEPDGKGHVSAWDAWCDIEGFPGKWDKGVLFDLKPSARIYTIDSYEDLARLMAKYKRHINYPEKTLDFEALAENFDALELTERGLGETHLSFPFNLYGWDVPSLLVLNFDVIADQQPLVKQETQISV